MNGLPNIEELIAEAQPKMKPLPEALRTYAEVVGDLRKRLHPSLISQLPKAGRKFDYVEWHTIVRLLDAAAPGWNISECRHEYNDGRHTVTVGISIPTADMGIITRANFGTDSEPRPDFNPETGQILPLGWRFRRDKGILVKDKVGNAVIEQEREQGTDPVTNAFAQAFKRAAAMFEAGLHLYYDKD